MADETTETTEHDEPTTDAAEAEAEGPKTKRSTPNVGIHSLLTRDSDQATRPGFRSPSNTKSKAQKKGKKGKKGRRK